MSPPAPDPDRFIGPRYDITDQPTPLQQAGKGLQLMDVPWEGALAFGVDPALNLYRLASPERQERAARSRQAFKDAFSLIPTGTLYDVSDIHGERSLTEQLAGIPLEMLVTGGGGAVLRGLRGASIARKLGMAARPIIKTAGEIAFEALSGKPHTLVPPQYPGRPIQQALAQASIGLLDVPGRPIINIGEEAASQVPGFGVPSNILGLRPIEAGLTRTQQWLNFARRTLGKPFAMIEDHELVQPLFAQARRVLPNASSEAVALARVAQAKVDKAFDVLDDGTIPFLIGTDPSLPAGRGPTIQGIAARFPIFRNSLDQAQVETMEWLRKSYAPYKRLSDELGRDVNIRADIINPGDPDGGFYLPRGEATPEGYDDPIRIFTGRGKGKPSHEKLAVYESMTHGIEKGEKYVSLQDALISYGRTEGERSVDVFNANYLKNLKDADGRLIASSPSMRVNPLLRQFVTQLRNKIRARGQTLMRQDVRASSAGRVAGTAGRRAEKAVEAAGDQTVEEILRDITIDISELQDFAYRHGRNRELLRQANVTLSAQEKKAYDRLAEIGAEANMKARLIGVEETSHAAEGLAEVGHAARASRPTLKIIRETQRNIDALMRDVDKLADTITDSAAKVDDLIEEGDIYADLIKGKRDELLQGRRTERVVMDRDRLVRQAERELERYQRLARRRGETEEVYNDLRDQLRDIEGMWRHEIAISKQPRGDLRGYQPINLPGLESWSFPEEIAAAAAKEIRAMKEPDFVLARAWMAFGNMYRALRATMDNSAMGIQGLLGLVNDPEAWWAAVKVSIQAWGRGGDKILGRFLNDFDTGAEKIGRLTSNRWGRIGVHIGGADTEYTLGTGLTQKLANLPGIRNANRAFGFFGDVERLSWADHLLAAEMRKGRSLQEIIDSGDAEKIASIVNNMTGWSTRRTGGSIGELLLFAPRFLQSRLETVVKGASGLAPGATIEQKIARKSLLKLIAYGVTTTFFVNEMLGNETDTRLFVDGRYNSNFMRIRYGDRDWSLFGTWDSLLRLIATVGAGGVQAVAERDPTRAVAGLSTAQRGMSSGGAAIAWDMITGENAMGESIFDKDDPTRVAGWLLESTAAFALQELPAVGKDLVQAAADHDIGAALAGAVTVLGETTGAKSFPISPSEARDKARQAAIDSNPDLTGTFAEQGRKDRDAINDTAAVMEAQAALDRSGLERKNKFYIYKGDRNLIRSEANEWIEALATKYGPGREFRNALKLHYAGVSSELKQLDRKSEEMLATLKNPEDETEYVFDQAYNDYVAQIFDEKGLEDPKTGEYLFEERTKRMADLERRHGAGLITEVENHLYRDQPEIIKELRADRRVLRPYWNITERVVEVLGVAEKFKEYSGLKQIQQPRYLRLNPDLDMAFKATAIAKRQMRENVPEIEALLKKWGYLNYTELESHMYALSESGQRLAVGQ